ncbi:unnamed protein product, partial [Iphiclides podalirius]
MMQPTPEGCMNIAELANQLRREKIFINSERQLLQNLNEEVEKSVQELLQVAWICSMQRQNLTNLISSRCEAESITACQRASLLESTAFIDAYKVLRYKEAMALGELLGWLRDTPHLVALCLILGEDHMPQSLPASLVAGLYGSCRLPTDRTRLLAVLRSLIKHQMATSNDPRKLFRTSKCALASLYSTFRDGHSPARRFLVAALHAPVMAVLHEDEFFLDIDPDKAMERFSASDRLKKFGQATSSEYSTKVTRYRKWTVQSLYNLATKFISSLRENWPNFPSAIAWIVQQIVRIMKQHSRISDRDLHAICTDIVFSQLICPAVVSPEAHGVVDVPVSYVARFNLMQVAQILQVLSLNYYQEVELKVRDLYSKFDRSCVWALVEGPDAVLRTDVPPRTTVALYTPHDAHLLITFLKRISSKLNNNTASLAPEESNGSGPAAEAAAFSEASEGDGGEGAARLAALLQTAEPNYRARLHDLLRKVPDLPALLACKTPTESKDTVSENGHGLKRGILAKVPKPRLPRSASSGSALHEGANGERDEAGAEQPEVLLIKLANTEESDYVGLVPESKVLESYYVGPEVGEEDAAAALVAPGAAPVQKRTRFSVSHDEVSLGNTSDNLEAVSEAASNHSVTSSLELETEDQNDNLSDMVSANVSGRGSPNISGRETPSSQVTDGDAAGEAAGEAAPRRVSQNNMPASQVASNEAKLLKQTRNDIEDKFCKFEIKLLEGDETISIMSDTWSTDVLASDSETIGDSCEQTQVAANQGGNTNNAPDVSETASESAWSMDVLASDSDRNTEVDTEDCASVAARSDTSWPRRASQQDDAPQRQPQPQQNGTKKSETSSPRHTSRYLPNNRYLSATAALSRGGELDLAPLASHAHAAFVENRKSILVNGYPVMTCYAASAPESPSTSAPAQMPNDVFDYVEQNSGSGQTESTLDEATVQSNATSQWVDDSFTHPHSSRPFQAAPKYDQPSTSKAFDEAEHMDRSLNSSESSFNALSVSQYERRFDSGIETERADSARSTITELMTRMSAASISAPAQRARQEGGPAGGVSLSTLSVNSAGTSASDRSSSQDVNSESVTEMRVSPPPQPAAKPSTGAIPKSISFDATAEKSQRRRIMGEDSLAGNLDELKNNVKRSGGNLLHKIKFFRQKGRSHHHHSDVKVPEEEARSDDGRAEAEAAAGAECSDDILAKYRRKGSDGARPRRPGLAELLVDPDLDRCEGVVDLDDPEVFNSMKRRLRTVLSNTDMHCVEYVPNRCTSTSLVEFVRAGGCAESAAVGRALAGGGAGAERRRRGRARPAWRQPCAPTSARGAPTPPTSPPAGRR